MLGKILISREQHILLYGVYLYVLILPVITHTCNPLNFQEIKGLLRLLLSHFLSTFTVLLNYSTPWEECQWCNKGFSFLPNTLEVRTSKHLGRRSLKQFSVASKCAGLNLLGYMSCATWLWPSTLPETGTVQPLYSLNNDCVSG